MGDRISVATLLIEKYGGKTKLGKLERISLTQEKAVGSETFREKLRNKRKKIKK